MAERKKANMVSTALLAAAAAVIMSGAAECADWPQCAANPQRTGRGTESIGTPLSKKWEHRFNFTSASQPSPERLYPANQPVIAGTRLFIGTEHGNFYCFDANTGSKLWKYPAGQTSKVGPILHAAGVEGSVVFFASMDGKVYALNVSDGSQKWVFNSGVFTGFSTAVLLAEGKVFAANRSGTLFAINQSNGSTAWQKSDFGCPLMQTPAYNNGYIYIAGADMRLRKIGASDGLQAWQTAVIPGFGIKDYWPIVHASKGIVMLTTMGILDARANSRAYCYSESNGSALSLVINISSYMDGAPAPNCLDRNGNFIGTWGEFGTGAWCRINPDTGARTDFTSKAAPDENHIASSSGDLIFIMHTNNRDSSSKVGYYNENTNSFTSLAGSIPGDLGHFGGNQQGGGACQPAVANARMYCTSMSVLYCFGQ